MPIYEYKCLKCDRVQEKQHKISETNGEKCENCEAEPKDLKRQLSPLGRHGSWSRWNVIK